MEDIFPRKIRKKVKSIRKIRNALVHYDFAGLIGSMACLEKPPEEILDHSVKTVGFESTSAGCMRLSVHVLEASAVSSNCLELSSRSFWHSKQAFIPYIHFAHDVAMLYVRLLPTRGNQFVNNSSVKPRLELPSCSPMLLFGLQRQETAAAPSMQPQRF